jgi:DNA polymerase zeta
VLGRAGRSVQEAFAIGAEISKEITARNPRPVHLKMEKVYSRCVLVAKKRYVGYMYEDPSQTEPVLDCKGLELVRRDTCALVSKAQELLFRTLFETLDLSRVKRNLTQLWTDMLSGTAPLQDYVFMKEVRLGTYSAKGPLPPAAIVASKHMLLDPRAEPRFGERIPYVVVHGEPGARLVDLVVSPETFLRYPAKLKLNNVYYISKQIIPALERILNLLGGDIRSWYQLMPKVTGPRLQLDSNFQNDGAGGNMPPPAPPTSAAAAASGSGVSVAAGANATGGRGSGLRGLMTATRTLDNYYSRRDCEICRSDTRGILCTSCAKDMQTSAMTLLHRKSDADAAMRELLKLCSACSRIKDTSSTGAPACQSLDCPVLFDRYRTTAAVCHSDNVLVDLGLAPSDEIELIIE